MRKYEEPMLEVQTFSIEDVITESPVDADGNINTPEAPIS